MVKIMPAMHETLVRPLGQEDPLEKGMVLAPVFLPVQDFHVQRSLVGYSRWSLTELDTTEY